MEDEQTPNHESLSTEEAAAKAAILAECEKFAAGGITFVAVHFDGSGDSGVTEEMKCFDSDYYAYEEHEPVDYDTTRTCRSTLRRWFRYGYENDCGGFGDVILNVKTRKITVERNDRFEDYTTSSYEV